MSDDFSKMFDDYKKSIQNIPEMVSRNSTSDMLKHLEHVGDSTRMEKLRNEEHQQNVLNALKNIEISTANLTEIVSLLHESNEKQNDIFELFVEILSITKAKNKEEAESKYRTVMKKISDFTGDLESVNKLAGFAFTVYNVVQTLF